MSNFFEAGKAAMTSDKDYWETPQDVFNELDHEFHFDLDPASTHENAKCKKHYTAEDDGLKQSWGGVCGLLQPSIWPRYWQVGTKGLRGSKEARYNRSYADTSKDRYKVLSRLHLSQSRGSVYSWPFEVLYRWRSWSVGPVSINDCCI